VSGRADGKRRDGGSGLTSSSLSWRLGQSANKQMLGLPPNPDPYGSWLLSDLSSPVESQASWVAAGDEFYLSIPGLS